MKGWHASLALGGVIVGGFLAYFTQRRHSQTGEPYGRIIAQLPAETRDTVADVRRRARAAFAEGKAAALRRDHELQLQIEARDQSAAEKARQET